MFIYYDAGYGGDRDDKKSITYCLNFVNGNLVSLRRKNKMRLHQALRQTVDLLFIRHARYGG